MKKIFFTIIFAFFIYCSSKQTLKDPIGKFDVIMTVTSKEIYNRYLPELKKIFEKEVMTPQREKEYNIVEGEFKNIEVYKRWRNIILIGLLNDASPASQFVVKSLSKDVLKLVRINQAFMFVKNDIWAKNQTVMFIVAKNDSLLKQNLFLYGDKIYQVFDQNVRKNMENAIFIKKEKKGLEKKLQKKYKFSIRIPQNFYLTKEFPDSNFVWINAAAPPRWIFIYWRDVKKGENIVINAKKAVELRDSLGVIFYNKDYIDKKHTKAMSTKFNGQQAIKLFGLWANDSLLVGGPFINYQFFDRNTRRYYMIDGAIFAPGIDKNIYLKKLDVILNTFRTFKDSIDS